MVKALLGTLIVFVLIVLVLTCVVYWFLNYTTLEKMGYADAEIAETELPNGESMVITPKTLGIENMTMKELYEWFRSRIDQGKEKE